MRTILAEDKRSADICSDALKKENTVLLIPTETVYGLVCAFSDSQAVKKIYELKKRESAKPLALFVHDISILEKHGFTIPENVKKLVRALCPGSVTFVVPQPDDSTLGFRIPDHNFVLELLRNFQKPLASTSANLSGKAPALNIQEALRSLNGEPDFAVDGGSLPKDSLASTVIKVSDNTFEILRPGPVKKETIENILKEN
jgi:L-threonylcarbamoyladenylate synthase